MFYATDLWLNVHEFVSLPSGDFAARRKGAYKQQGFIKPFELEYASFSSSVFCFNFF